MAYVKTKNYKSLIDSAAAAGDYKAAAQYEKLRNDKIAGESMTGYAPTRDYAGWLDDTDYSDVLRDQMSSGADAYDVADTLGKRVEKASGTVGMSQYAHDDTYRAAMDYILNGSKNAPDFQYEDAPSWASKYTAQIDDLTRSFLAREKFAYNPETDPLYSVYRDAYTREGSRAMDDTIGRISARTGGLASSYASSAAAQANNDYMSRLADKIPELQQLAYSMYMTDGDTQRQGIDLLRSLDASDYSQYADQRAQYNSDRSFGYGVYADAQSRQYQRDRDTAADSLAAEELNYRTQQDAQNRIADFFSAGGKASALDSTLISDSGYSPSELAAFEAATAKAAIPKASGRASGQNAQLDSDAEASTIYQQMAIAGIDTEADAYDYLIRHGYNTTQAGKLATYYNTKKTAGEFQPEFRPGPVITDGKIDRYAEQAQNHGYAYSALEALAAQGVPAEAIASAAHDMYLGGAINFDTYTQLVGVFASR